MREEFRAEPDRAQVLRRRRDRRLHPLAGDLPQRRPDRLRRAAAAARARARSPGSCSTTATSSRRSTSPARAWPASRTGWPGPASWCCTPTTAATPRSDPARAARPRVPARATRATRSTRYSRSSSEPYVDPDRMAMLGRSMGGGVTLNALVAQPGPGRRRGHLRVGELALPRQPAALHRARAGRRRRRRSTTGSARRARSRAFYRELSSRTFFDRITEPVLIHHGTDDESCPFPWARTTQRLLRKAGVRRAGSRSTPGEHALLRPAVAGLDRADRAVPPPSSSGRAELARPDL